LAKGSRNNHGRIVTIIVVLVVLALSGVVFFIHAYEYNIIANDVNCNEINPDNLPCEDIAQSWGNVVNIQLSTAPGWFLDLGEQPKLEVTVFVPPTNATFTQEFLGCNNPFRVGENVSIGIGVYNATYPYYSTQNFATQTVPNSLVTNTSLDQLTIITLTSSSNVITTSVDEIGRSYFVVPIPSGCAMR
jgi:hypothetical protein